MSKAFMTRRAFLGFAGVASASLILGGCSAEAPVEAPVEAEPSSGESAQSSPTPETAAPSASSANEPQTAPQEETPMPAESKILVAYFSNTGNTKAEAEKLAAVTGGTLFAIEAAEPYTAADLDYNDDSARCMIELNDPTSRPAIANTVPDWDSYDTVFVGYPIWWSRTPPIMETFAESYDWAGKTAIPFCTSGSSSIGQSASVLAEETPGAMWLAGQRFSTSVTEADLESWVASLGI